MDTVTLVCRLLIAATFLAASLGKSWDIATTRRTLRDFGIPLRLASPLGTLLPIAELIVGGGLLFAATAWWSAIAAGALLASFGVAICANLLMGRKPDCNCFGQVHSAPIGKKTLATNLLLLSGAVLLIARGNTFMGASFPDILASLTVTELIVAAAFMLVCAACAAVTWFLLQLYKQNGRLLERIEALEQSAGPARQKAVIPSSSPESPRIGLATGSAAPAFELEMLTGGQTTLAALLAPGRPLLLIFIDPNCGPCAALLPTIVKWQADYAQVFTAVIISQGTREDNRRKIADHRIPNVLLQKDREVSTTYQCYGTPGAVVVDENGRIASSVAQGVVDIESLATHSYRNLIAKTNSSLKRGSPAPDLVLNGLSGETIKLSEFKGRRLVLLFWNPLCGFCSRMLKNLVSWEQVHGNGDASLLVVSRGSADENRRLGLRSPIVLDDDFVAGRSFGVGGTPSAVLIDENGVIASSTAVGADQVFLLLGDDRAPILVQGMPIAAT